MTEPTTGTESAGHKRDRHTLALVADDDSPLMITRYGKPGAAATVVYLHGPFGDATSLAPLIGEIHQHFGGEIAQLVYDQRGHRNGVAFGADRPGMAQLVADLDVVMSHASGRVVLVVESLAAILLQEWLFRHRRGVLRLDAVVAICPVPELPSAEGSVREERTDPACRIPIRLDVELLVAFGILDSDNGLPIFDSVDALIGALGRFEADVAVVEDMLRATPTWIVAGKKDWVADYRRVAELADTVWAESILVDDASHDLIHTHTRIAADAVVAALQAAHAQSWLTDGWLTGS
ncbi:alpha/beta hydrolase [Nocardia asteroides]|uniref:alpha/beta hydrolase n=1 Tax=Nocardia asteroides TaxID=1824 RepID=UPI0037C896A4